MGLDVYLYRYEKPMEEVDRLEAEAEKLHDAIGDEVLRTFGAKDFSALTKEQHGDYFAACKREYEKHGLDKYGSATDAALGKTRVEHKDPRYPDHYFEIGYFRSSYNGGGINNVMRRAGLGDLHDIFEPGDRYRFVPDWRASLERAKSLAADYDKHIGVTGGVDVTIFEANAFINPRELPQSERAALDIWLRERERYKPRPDGDFAAYSNRDGEFYMDKPMKVRAAIPGIHDSFAGPHPCVYVVTESEKKDGEPDWYASALQIVIATIEYVLAQPQPEQYALHWSG